jgi:hypothetical protein
LLVLDAPNNYSGLPATMALQSLIGRFPGQTADEVAQAWYGTSDAHPEYSVQLVGQVMDCTIAASPGAVFQYTSQRSQLVIGNGAGPFDGYMFVLLHKVRCAETP